MTVYLDVIFLENICMNYIILFATCLINKNKTNHIRLILASTLGSIYACISYILSSSNLSNVLIKILLSVAIVNLGLKPKNIKVLFKYLIIFYLTSFAFGGCAFFLLYFIRPQDILIRNGVLIGTYPIKIAVLGGILGFIIINIAFSIIKGKITKKDMFCMIEIYLFNKSIQTKSIIDTGNLLKEPITQLPVIVVEKNILEKLIPMEILKNIDAVIKGNIKEEYPYGDYELRLRVIPFTSIGKENGMLVGIKADKVVIEFQDNKFEINDVIIGIYDKMLSSLENYHALIGIDVLQQSSKKINRKQGEEHEFITNTKI